MRKLLLPLKIQTKVHISHLCIKGIKGFNLLNINSYPSPVIKALYFENRIIKPLKIILKNSFVCPFSHKPASGHESCLLDTINISNAQLINIVENLLTIIKK